MIDEKDFISFLTVKKGLSEQSIRHCRIRLNVIEKWFENKIISKETVEQFFLALKERKLNNNTLNTYYFVLRQIQDYLDDRGKPNNFMQGFKSFTKVKSVIKILTPDEIDKLIHSHLEYGKFCKLSAKEVTELLDFRYRTALMFLSYTGCRFEEMSGLLVKDIDCSLGKAVFTETKNKNIRYAHLPLPLIENLKILMEGKTDNQLVFTSLTGREIHRSDFMYDLRKRALSVGITKRVHPHLFRHSFATQLLLSGVEITMVAAILGHRDIQTTYANYVHLADETLKKATYRHPLIRQTVEPKEIIKNIRDTLHSLHLDSDSRFSYKLEEGQNSLSFTVFVK